MQEQELSITTAAAAAAAVSKQETCPGMAFEVREQGDTLLCSRVTSPSIPGIAVIPELCDLQVPDIRVASGG